MAKRLIENSANVNSADDDGWTALHYAAYTNSAKVAKILIANSADLNATAVSGIYSGLTPLRVAEKKEYPEMVEL